MPVSAPAPSSSSSTAAWNVDARALAEVRGPDRDGRALLDLALPRRSRRRRRSRPARRARAPRGRPRASPRAPPRCAPEANTSARSHARRRGRRGRSGAGLERPRARVGARREAGADPDGHRLRRYSRRRPCSRACRRPSSRSSGPTGVGKTAVAIALAERLRAAGEDPVAVSADALQVYARPGDPHRGRRRRGARASSSTGCSSFLPVDATVQRRRVRPARARRDRRAARGGPAADRRRRHRPLPARRAGRARPAPARRRPTIRARRREQLEPRGAAALHAELARRATRGGRGDRPRRRPARHPRARAARRRPRAARAAPQLWTAETAPPDAARRPDDGPRGAARAASTPASTRWSRPARPRRSARRRGRRVATAPPGARLRGAARRRRRGDEARRRAATPGAS